MPFPEFVTNHADAAQPNRAISERDKLFAALEHGFYALG